MGYYTSYNLLVDGKKYTDHHTAIGEASGYGECLFDGEPVKWYDHVEEMVAYSKKHPDILFTLDGEGEENGDVWRMWFKNGRHEVWRQPAPTPPEHPGGLW